MAELDFGTFSTRSMYRPRVPRTPKVISSPSGSSPETLSSSFPKLEGPSLTMTTTSDPRLEEFDSLDPGDIYDVNLGGMLLREKEGEEEGDGEECDEDKGELCNDDNGGGIDE